jgi:hypothetical protein
MRDGGDLCTQSRTFSLNSLYFQVRSPKTVPTGLSIITRGRQDYCRVQVQAQALDPGRTVRTRRIRMQPRRRAEEAIALADMQIPLDAEVDAATLDALFQERSSQGNRELLEYIFDTELA